MALAAFSDLQALPVSEKITVVEVYPNELITSGWVLSTNGASADIYYCSLATLDYSPVSAVKRDDTACTEQASEAACDTATVSYYFDQNAQRLYVNVGIGDEPSDYDYAVTHYLAFSDKPSSPIDTGTHTASPRLASMAELKLDSRGLISGVHFPDKGKLEIDNRDSALDSLFIRCDWYGSRVRVWFGGDDLAFANYYQFLDGWVDKDPKMALDKITLKLVDKRSRLKGKVDFTVLDRATYPGLDHAYDGKPLPIIYGSVEGVPLICLTRHYTLHSDIDNSQTSGVILREDLTATVGGRYQFPDKGRIKIADERIQYTGVTRATGELTGVTRGHGSTKKASHTSGDEIMMKRSETSSDIDGMKFCIANSVDTASTRAVYKDGEELDENDYIWNASNVHTISINDTPMPRDVDLTADVSGEETGGVLITNYADVIKDFLTDILGYDGTDDIDSTSFATAATKCDGTVALYISQDDKIQDILDMLLLGCMGRLTLTAAGKIGLSIWEPIIETSLDTLDTTVYSIAGWDVEKDYGQVFGRVKIRYGRDYKVDDDEDGAWRAVTAANPYTGRVYPDDLDVYEADIPETNAIQAQAIAERMSWIGERPTHKVTVKMAGIEMLDKRPGNQVRLTLPRPSSISDDVYEVQQIKFGRSGVELEMNDLNGLGVHGGAITADTANAWSGASTDEKDGNMFLADDDGYIDTTDDSTRNLKRIW